MTEHRNGNSEAEHPGAEDGGAGPGGGWPRCEECGSQLQQAQIDFTQADFSEGRTGVPVTQDFCPNPDCTRHDADLAAAAGDPRPEVRDLPGSLGGDHGGG